MAKNIKNIIEEAYVFINDLKRKKYSVLLDTTNGCNLRCTFCTRDNDKIVCMKTEEFDGLLTKIHKDVNALQLSCAWEYSVAKNAAEIIRTLGKYSLPQTTIYTNGNILTNEIAKALIDARIGDFVVSIGEVKKETYEKLRKGGNFERVLSNIGKLLSYKKEFKSKFPRVCTNLTVVNSNIGELVEFVDLAHNVGVERIIGRHLILNQGLDVDNEVIKDKVLANGIIAEAEKRALAYGMSFSIPKYENEFKPKTCRAPWHQLYISSNGDVSVCPRIHVHEKIGNLVTDSFCNVVSSKKLKSLKKQFDKLDFNNPVCGICMENLETEQSIDQGF